jgi:hypothetical protein
MEFEALVNGYAILTFEDSVRRVIRVAVTPPCFSQICRGVGVYSC